MLWKRLIDCLHQRCKSERRKVNPCRAKVFTRSDRSIVYFYFLFRIRQLFFIHCNWLYPATQFFNNTVPHQPKFIEVIQILERNSQFESQAVSDLNDLSSEYYMFSDGAHCAPVNLICLFLTQYRERDGMTFQPFSLLHFHHPSASPDICMI